MRVLEKIKKVFRGALTSGWSPEKLTMSFCMGIYIAFSPFPGAHTLMMLAAKWLFKLNFPILFVTTSFNNPWTMIPFFTLDYVFGYWFLHNFLGWNPGWVISLTKVFGSGTICLWSFLIGGNVLGILAALLCYPFMTIVFRKLASRFSVAATEK